jgi:hypothetical protein
MIFSSVNEDGIPAWKLVMEGKKTVTRRLRPQPVGAVRAVQPKRCAGGLGFIKIVDCSKHTFWDEINKFSELEPNRDVYYREALEREANREGFKTWDGLLSALDKFKADINDTYRIEFKLIERRKDDR